MQAYLLVRVYWDMGTGVTDQCEMVQLLLYEFLVENFKTSIFSISPKKKKQKQMKHTFPSTEPSGNSSYYI